MKPILFALSAAIGLLIFVPSAHAVTCAEGVYRAGCAGPNGAAVVRKAPPPPHPVSPGTVTCAKGIYREGCAGPNGAVVRPRY